MSQAIEQPIIKDGSAEVFGFYEAVRILINNAKPGSIPVSLLAHQALRT